MRLLIPLLFACLAFAQDAIVQDTRVSLTGTVLGTNDQPLRKTNLLLQPQGGTQPGLPSSQPWSTTTDNSGQFSLTGVEPGVYTLMAEHTGYLRGFYGAKPGASSAVTLNLAPGQTMTDLVIHLIEQSAITGVVTDEDGDPVPRIQVRLLRRSWVNGQRQLAPTGFAQTDDVGGYRIGGITAGQYYLTAEPQPNQPQPRRIVPRGQQQETPVNTFYPGVTAPEAAVLIRLTAGETRTALNIRMARAAASHIRGTVTGLVAVARSRVTVTPSGAISIPGINYASALTPDGTFDVAGVPPGLWNIGVIRNEGAPQYLGSRTIQVSGQDLEGIVLNALPVPPISGTVRMDGSDSPPPPVRVQLTPTEGAPIGPQAATADKDGKFSLAGAGTGKFRIVVTGIPAGSFVKSIQMNGLDVLEPGLELNGSEGTLNMDILLSPAAAVLNGAVIGPDGNAAPGAVVTLIHDPPHPDMAQLYQRVNTDQNGIFAMPAVTPGNYKAIAWPELEAGGQYDPEIMRGNEDKAVTVTLAEGEHQVVTLVSVGSN